LIAKYLSSDRETFDKKKYLSNNKETPNEKALKQRPKQQQRKS
jgi:hypothetical protein